MKKRNFKISKSSFIKGLQCHKALYLKKHHPELEDEISEAQQAIFDKGTNVGLLAQRLFPGGRDLGVYIPEKFFEVFKQTSYLVYKDEPIYEAGFTKENLLCFMDILVKQNGKWSAYEVKGSTSIKDTYLWDAAFQYHVISLTGIELEDISIVYLNTAYVRKGNLDLNELFVIESVKERILPLIPDVIKYIQEMKTMLGEETPPNIPIGTQCSKPYDCSFRGHCWKGIPDYSIFNIARLKEEKKFELYEQGILNLSDVPDDFPLSDSQKLQVEMEKTKETMINTDEIKAFVNKLNYPLYFLDFETFQSSVPLFDQSSAFQQICFQYSLHILHKPDGDLEHKEFLAKNTHDPRIPFINNLLKDMGDNGDIIVYNQGFESARLQEIARDFPIYQNRIEPLIDRMQDLMSPFLQKHYYTPEMQGSFSIKKVLPALVSELNYESLDIKEGANASIAFEALYRERDEAIIQKTRADLLAYCKMDTLAMVEILKVLMKVE